MARQPAQRFGAELVERALLQAGRFGHLTLRLPGVD
jgi:hypothetical protein